MSDQPDGTTALPEGSQIASVISLSETEWGSWEREAAAVGCPVGIFFRLCAYSGLAHHLYHHGQYEEAAMVALIGEVLARNNNVQMVALGDTDDAPTGPAGRA